MTHRRAGEEGWPIVVSFAAVGGGRRCAFEIWSLVPQINNAFKSHASGYRQHFECVGGLRADAAVSAAAAAAAALGLVSG